MCGCDSWWPGTITEVTANITITATRTNIKVTERLEVLRESPKGGRHKMSTRCRTDGTRRPVPGRAAADLQSVKNATAVKCMQQSKTQKNKGYVTSGSTCEPAWRAAHCGVSAADRDPQPTSNIPSFSLQKAHSSFTYVHVHARTHTHTAVHRHQSSHPALVCGAVWHCVRSSDVQRSPARGPNKPLSSPQAQGWIQTAISYYMAAVDHIVSPPNPSAEALPPV